MPASKKTAHPLKHASIGSWHAVHTKVVRETVVSDRFHSARGYVIFDRAIRKVEAWLFRRDAHGACSAREEVARRVVQRIVEIGLHDFIATCARRAERGEEPLPREGSAYHCGGLVIDSASGRTRVGPALFARSLALFAAHWAHALWIHFTALFARDRRGPATLVYGVGAAELNHGGNDADFIAFCRHGPIAPLRTAGRYVVQTLAEITRTQTRECTYARVPLFALAVENPVRIAAFLRFASQHVLAFFNFVSKVARFPLMCLLARDLAYTATAARLEAEGLIENVIITNSNYSAQPLWMRPHEGRRHATHMVWYSQNCIPFVYAFDPVRTQLPNHRHMAFDETWVWTEGFGDYIRSLGTDARIHVVGPIVFYPPKPAAGDDDGALRVMVFDVTPVRPEVAHRIGLAYNYYSAENLLKFITDIVTAAARTEEKLGRKVRLVLKHKRSHEPTRDPGYVAAIERFTEAGALQLESPDTNVYALISRADVVIAVPWSSPVYVAQDAGKPALYYDPTGELLPAHEAAADVPFVAGAAKLEQRLLEMLGGERRPAEARDPAYPRTA